MIADRFSDDMKRLQGMGVNVLSVMSNDYQTVEADSPQNLRNSTDLHFRI